ncbi:hypothetical protein BLOT_000139 [Blomia tropicalis]|nr:hypothetical protein BLOT_000139 [Blomia tropicalis]
MDGKRHWSVKHWYSNSITEQKKTFCDECGSMASGNVHLSLQESINNKLKCLFRSVQRCRSYANEHCWPKQTSSLFPFMFLYKNQTISLIVGCRNDLFAYCAFIAQTQRYNTKTAIVNGIL